MGSFTAQHVRQAFAAIRDNDGKTEGFEKSRKWDIVDYVTGDRFPPKAVLFRAMRFANDKAFAGGGGDRGTNIALRKRGFRVILKPELARGRGYRCNSNLRSRCDIEKAAY